MDDFKIESGVPIASKRAFSRKRALVLSPLAKAFGTMGVGDSFVVDREVAMQKAHPYAKRAGVKVAIRDIGGGKARIWRVA